MNSYEMNNLLKELQKLTPEEIDVLVQSASKDSEQISLQHSSEEKLKSQIDEIPRILKILGISPAIKGYKYARAAIKFVVKSEQELSITKDVYPEVAKEMETTASRVERAIRHGVEQCFEKGNRNVIDEIFQFSYSPYKGKPTNSEFIFVLAELIKETPLERLKKL